MIGRPPLRPRVEALEKLVKQLEERIAKLELIRGSRIPIPQIEEPYQPQFSKWPGNVNGS
jgi:hypothetical protein